MSTILVDTLKYCKVRKVKSISRAHPEDAGIDFYVPEDLDIETMKSKISTTHDDVDMLVDDTTNVVIAINLKPGQSVLIPSGIHVRIPHGYALIYMNKSGVASKKHLHVGACVVDENYEGECHLNLTNVGTESVTISAGEKIVQGLVVPVSYCQTKEVFSLEELYAGSKSDRGAGGFGSSGIK